MNISFLFFGCASNIGTFILHVYDLVNNTWGIPNMKWYLYFKFRATLKYTTSIILLKLPKVYFTPGGFWLILLSSLINDRQQQTLII